MGAVEKDLAAYERRIHKEDLDETAREKAIEDEVARLRQLTLERIVVEALRLDLVSVDLEDVVVAIAAAIVDARKPDDGFDPDNRPSPRDWSGR